MWSREQDAVAAEPVSGPADHLAFEHLMSYVESARGDHVSSVQARTWEMA